MAIAKKLAIIFTRFLLLSFLLSACGSSASVATAPAPTPVPAPQSRSWCTHPRATVVDPGPMLPLLAAHQQQMRVALQQPIPILTLQKGIDNNQNQAQTLAIHDARFQADLHDPATGAALRNEIFGIYPFRESDVISATAVCRQTQCYRVEMYNYAVNLTTLATVDVPNHTVLSVARVPFTQPDIPPGSLRLRWRSPPMHPKWRKP